MTTGIYFAIIFKIHLILTHFLNYFQNYWFVGIAYLWNESNE